MSDETGNGSAMSTHESSASVDGASLWPGMIESADIDPLILVGIWVIAAIALIAAIVTNRKPQPGDKPWKWIEPAIWGVGVVATIAATIIIGSRFAAA